MRWSWHGAVALALGICIAGGWAAALVLTVLDNDEMTTGSAALLYGLGGTLIGAVASWLGGQTARPDPRRGRHARHEPPTVEREPE